MPRPSTRFLSFLNAFGDDVGHEGETFWRINWNFVDVPDAQGTLRHGMVVDATETGLLVDFSDGQSPRTVEYGRAFRVPNFTEKSIQNADNIQVLVRITNDLPFTWFAGKLLDPDRSMCPTRLVEVQFEVDGVVNRELVHTSQIRDAPNAVHERFMGNDPLIVTEGCFTTVQCPLPDSYASLSESSPLWKIFSQYLYEECNILAMGIRNGNVEYLGSKDDIDKDFDSFYMENCLDDAAKHLGECLKKGLVWTGSSHTMARITVQPDDQSSCAQLLSLPAILLVEIFQFLDSVDRVAQRRVCPQWNDILGTQSIFTDVRVTLKYPYDCPFKWSVWDGLQAVVMVMASLVTKHTKWVIIVDSPDSRLRIVQHTEVLFRLLLQVARHFPFPAGGKLSLVISQYKWRSYLDSLRWGLKGLASLCTELASTYNKVVWKDCMFEKSYWENSGFWDSGIVVGKGSIKVASSNVQADLWEMLDSSVPETDLEMIAMWLAGLEHDNAKVQKILKEFQIADPRLTAKSTLYRSDELAHVDWRQLQVGRLTRLTLWMLAQRKAKDESDEADWETESEDNGETDSEDDGETESEDG